MYKDLGDIKYAQQGRLWMPYILWQCSMVGINVLKSFCRWKPRRISKLEPFAK